MSSQNPTAANDNKVVSISTPNIVPVSAQTAEAFLQLKFPPKETLIEDLLYLRDGVALGGRRRHGKTGFMMNLGLSLAVGKPKFLGYTIPKAARVLMFFLEDDGAELQMRLSPLMSAGSTEGRLAVYSKETFYRSGLAIDVRNTACAKFIREICAAHKPQLVVFDNLAHMIAGEYMEPSVMHKVYQFTSKLTDSFNCAVAIAAHPKKRNESSGIMGSHFQDDRDLLKNNAEQFFEQIMGSSHFVNSFGSLWGIARNVKTNETTFLGGTQRLTGEEMAIDIEKGDDGWFHVSSNIDGNLRQVLSTDKRIGAWLSLPPLFSFTDGEKRVSGYLKAGPFHALFKELKRIGAIVECGSQWTKHPGRAWNAV